MLSNIHFESRVLIVLLLLITGLVVGYIFGLRIESDRRDAIELAQKRADDNAFQSALLKGHLHAEAALKWQRRAQTYYRNWKERLDHETNANLAQCQTQSGAQPQAGDVLLSGTFVSLYNAAWLPQLDADPSGAAAKGIEAGAAAPRDVLANVGLNANLCADDRKRLDELIDLLMEPK